MDIHQSRTLFSSLMIIPTIKEVEMKNSGTANKFGSALKKIKIISIFTMIFMLFCSHSSLAVTREEIIEQLKTVQSYEEVAKTVISNAIINDGIDIEDISKLLMEAVVQFATEMNDNIAQSIQSASKGAIVGTIQTTAQVGMDVKKNTSIASKIIVQNAIYACTNTNISSNEIVQSVSKGTANGVVMVAAGSSDVGIMMDLTEGASEGIVNGTIEAAVSSGQSEAAKAESVEAATKGCITAIKDAISTTAIDAAPIIEASISGAIKGSGEDKVLVANTLSNMQDVIPEVDVNKFVVPIMEGTDEAQVQEEIVEESEEVVEDEQKEDVEETEAQEVTEEPEYAVEDDGEDTYEEKTDETTTTEVTIPWTPTTTPSTVTTTTTRQEPTSPHK